MSDATAQADAEYLRRAIRLAINGRGRAEPNPLVGCVIVKDGHVIGGGYHQKYGQPHAEPNALDSCIEPPTGATAYVTLEPCCHTNKQTPPCVPRLIEAGVTRVVVGCTDPNPDVNGQGIVQLRAAGIRVDAPLLEAESRQLIAPFIARTVHRRPYITLKWAQTAEGKVAGKSGRPMQITNERASRLVHTLRSRSQAIAVGIGTALADDPRLTARDLPVGAHNAQLLRVVLDASLHISPIAKLFNPDDATAPPVRIYHRAGGVADRIRELAMAGATLCALPVRDDGRLSLADMLHDLYEQRVAHLMVEPGPTLASGFFDENLADRLWLFRSPKRVDDATAPSAVAIPKHFVKSGELALEGDTLTEYLNPRSAVFFANEPSADLVLAGA